MAAYLVGHMTITDPEAYLRYRSAFVPDLRTVRR
jgi:hypothetical protein